MTEFAMFNGDKVEMETSRINLVCNKTHGASIYSDRLAIDTKMSMDHYEWLEEVSDVAACLFKVAVHDWQGPVTKNALATCQPCLQRLAGMLDLTVRAMSLQQPFAWKYPEDGLHPMYQGNIADVMIALTDPPALRALLETHLA